MSKTQYIALGTDKNNGNFFARTHKVDVNTGVLKQLVSPKILRKLALETLGSIARPPGLEPDDEWKV